MSSISRVTIASLAVLIVSLYDVSRCENSVRIETKSFPPGAQDAAVGIYIENDENLGSFVLPLELRSVDSMSFIEQSLSVDAVGRILLLAGDGTSVIRKYASRVTGYPDSYCVGGDSSYGVWSPTGNVVDFVSPDALLYARIAYDSVFYAGSDTAQGSAGPSLILRFGVSSVIGRFIIDTTCTPPFNHLTFATTGEITQSILPSFDRGVIEIGGPFWALDSITGHIQSNLAIMGDVIVTGDLVIDSGITLTLVRGSSLLIQPYDDQLGGSDSSRVEIEVKGTLAIDPTNGNRPTVLSSEDSASSWYGIRVKPGGRFDTGIGAVIKDAVIGLRIDKGPVADTLSGLTVSNCDSVGISNGGLNVALIGDTVFGIPSGIGIYVDSGGPLLKECYVESCGTGILTYKSWSTIRGTNVIGPGQYGIRIDNNPIIPIEGKNRNPKGPILMATDVQVYQVSLSADTVSGYFSDGQLSMGLMSSICSVDSCGFVHPSGVQRSPYGLNLGAKDTVTVRHSLISGFTTAGVNSVGSKVNLGISPSSLGNNDIATDSAGCSGCLLRRVKHTGLDSLKAEGNWWGAASPSSAWFNGKVDWNPYLSNPPAKFGVPDHLTESATLPIEYSLGQNYPNPFNASTEIEFSLTSTKMVELTIYNILGQTVKRLADRDFSAGTHRLTWDATNSDGNRVASGVYLYRITVGDFVESKKMVLLK